MFKYENHTISFADCVQIGKLYVKDLVKDKGQFKTLQDLSDVLSRKPIGYVNIRYWKLLLLEKNLRFGHTYKIF